MLPSDDAAAEATGPAGPSPSAARRRPDWLGWLVLAWVLFWGTAYVFTAIQARCPRLATWLRSGSVHHGVPGWLLDRALDATGP